ncbi:hypothetical protein AB0M44_33345 [Streptosporangium subroseum]|uniref:hypothetical protein n=1 Tax=Streptosporangium subroseum TaxID=106412 RepID=UPI003412506D
MDGLVAIVVGDSCLWCHARRRFARVHRLTALLYSRVAGGMNTTRNTSDHSIDAGTACRSGQALGPSPFFGGDRLDQALDQGLSVFDECGADGRFFDVGYHACRCHDGPHASRADPEFWAWRLATLW